MNLVNIQSAYLCEFCGHIILPQTTQINADCPFFASIGNKDEISTYRLSIKPQELLDLLSQRLEAYRSTHA